jgi:uncharacterized protein (DUF885 family)
MSTTDHRSPVFAFASDVVDRDAELDPILATNSGITTYDHLLPDFSPAREQREITLVHEFIDELNGLSASDDIDRVALAVLRERLESRLGLLESGETAKTFSVIDSPLANIRQVFELMATDTAEQRAVIAQRLRQVRPSLVSWRLTMEELAATKQLPSRRHVRGVAEQAATHASGGYCDFAERIADGDKEELLESARDAEAACQELATWMNEQLVPDTSEHDPVGPARYAAWSSYWTGANLDFEELYAWGWQDLRRINERMWTIVKEIAPGATTLVEAAAMLDADPERAIVGTDELLRRLKAFTANATEALDGVQFDIDERIRFCDARLAPEGSAAAPFYVAPSEDLSRPGTTWFPTMGATSFSWWRFASTWYHEGVPGHHLQCALAIIEADRQSRFHRLEGWTSGYGEGWALYAERLMDELGFFSDPGDEMGHLADQALRAARVMVDIGLHFEFAAPDDIGELGDLGDCAGKVWTAPMAVAVLEQFALQDHEMSTSEVDRYLGMPAQAISYKVGERVWMRSREEARQRFGDTFSLKKFHAYALALGPMGLDPFEEELRRWDGA